MYNLILDQVGRFFAFWGPALQSHIIAADHFPSLCYYVLYIILKLSAIHCICWIKKLLFVSNWFCFGWNYVICLLLYQLYLLSVLIHWLLCDVINCWRNRMWRMRRLFRQNFNPTSLFSNQPRTFSINGTDSRQQ